MTIIEATPLHRLLHWVEGWWPFAWVPWHVLTDIDLVSRREGRVILMGGRCKVCGTVQGIIETFADDPRGARMIAEPREDAEDGDRWEVVEDEKSDLIQVMLRIGEAKT